MASILPNKLSKITCCVALDLGLPWRVMELLERAFEARRTVEERAAKSGLSGEQASKQIAQHIYEQVTKSCKTWRSLPPNQKKPTPEQIGTALESFSLEEWIALLGSVGRIGTGALLSYIRHGADELKQRPGARKVERIEARAIMRDIELWLDEHRSELVPISDVYWAGALRDLALEANTKGKGHPAKGPPMAEQAKAPHIARRLSKRDEQTGCEMNVSAYEVEQWWKRIEKLPFEQFAADRGPTTKRSVQPPSLTTGP